MKNKQAFNPFLPSYEYIPDGEPRVFDGRVYIYGSHDRFNGNKYCLNDYVCWSAPIYNLSDWRFEGEIYNRKQDTLFEGGLRCMFAPDVVQGIDGRYYLYYTLDVSGVTSVAVCGTPAGKYEFYGHVTHADGEKLGTKAGDAFQFDPGVLVDNNKVYLYTGFGCIPGSQFEPLSKIKVLDGAYCYELESNMLTVKGKGTFIAPAPIALDGDPSYRGHEFYEASSPRKYGNSYYLVYSSVLSHELCYSISDRPDGGFKFGGTIVSIGDIGYNGIMQNNALNYLNNTHGGMVEIEGSIYIFYHRHTNGTPFSRQACAEQITVAEDGSIAQVEITSCGLNKGVLRGTGRYPAYIACNLYSGEGAGIYGEGDFSLHPRITQDGEDREEGADQYIANMQNGATAGFKYFDLSDTTGISVEVRGTGKGKLIIFSENQIELCTLDIAPTKDFKSFKAKFKNKPKTPKRSPIYLCYDGEGAIDINSFTLK